MFESVLSYLSDIETESHVFVAIRNIRIGNFEIILRTDQII